MMALSMRRRTWSGLSVSLAAGLLAAIAAAPPARSASEVLMVVLDEAKLVKLPDRLATLVIGNPLIADAALQAGGYIVLTGKSYGSTNLMALDRSGKVLVEKTILVRAPGDTVVVYRGIERQTYSCTPECDHRIMLGDSAAAFTATLDQTGKRNTQALAAGR